MDSWAALPVAAFAVCLAARADALGLGLLRPEGVSQPDPENSYAGDVLHPLPYPTALDGPEAGKTTADGLLFTVALPTSDAVEAARAVSGARTGQPTASLFFQLFTISYASPVDVVEKWFTESNAPTSKNHLRFSTIFDSFFGAQHGGLIRDEHGDACLGSFLKAELCVQAISCMKLDSGPEAVLPYVQLWAPTPVATNYRLEAYVSGDPCEDGLEALPVGGEEATLNGWPRIRRLRRLVEAPVNNAGGTFIIGADRKPIVAQHVGFRLLFADESSAWWSQRQVGSNAPMPTICWMDMMGSVLSATEPWMARKEALWLEFGVASGRSLAFIASRLRAVEHILVHAFDSFKGIPQGWHRYNAESFSMDGRPPEFLESMQNVKLHIGYFHETLPNLAPYRSWPVAFAHIDVDLFASAREVLLHLRCQLVTGTILVFDEWFNYLGWQRDGEYRAWRLLSEMYGMRWQPLGVFFEQAMAVVIEEGPEGC
eukprot:gnl/TRDRNA2_/TRDRNA2_190906_c0_seq1.p1 gnl/TRDRNA2_/TRDRNA2_190906_c0~~gnl/TRDRNA2_/TRDRNA2_190906_c0_seq1.p1  ORF type:complete len:485 (+),score=78.18 gnl/TRDRNA2_/TRDRNA2_190906_c0_seq1:52-1506(+)